MDGKRKEIEPLQQALGKLRGPTNANRDNRSFICSSEQELNDVVSPVLIKHPDVCLFLCSGFIYFLYLGFM